MGRSARFYRSMQEGTLMMRLAKLFKPLRIIQERIRKNCYLLT